MLAVIIFCRCAYGQSLPSGEEKWGIVLDHPGMKDVNVVSGIEYAKGQQGTSLQLDIYTPPSPSNSAGSIVF